MRAFCTVSAPLEVCASSAEQLSPGSRFLALRLLGNQQPKTLYFLVDAKSRVREVYTQTCLHFATQGMQDTELFGLAVLIDGEYMFADPESKLSKYGPKSWRSSHTHGLDANGRPLLELHYRVQFYIESPFMLKDEISRHNYYLQLKYNALQRDMLGPKEYSEQSMILLAALALQADLGDAPLPTTPAKAGSGVAAKEKNVQYLELEGAVQTESNTDDVEVFTKSTTKTTTTLPKINKKTSSANERVLRLSTYVASTLSSSSGSSTGTSNSTSNSIVSSPDAATPSSHTVLPKSGSIKHGLGGVATTLSPTSSSLSINRHASPPLPYATPAAKSPAPNMDYFRLEDYLPPFLRTASAVSALKACHRENRNLSSADAELQYIRQACVVHESINAHTYRMRMSKSEHGPGNSWFVIYAKGIKIDGVGDSPQQQITFLWPNITKLSFERKKFEIRSGESKITLYTTSDEKNKMLLTLCKETHQFSMKMAARLKEVIKREEEESSSLHACYSYSRSLHLPYKNKNDQRISVISSTSSNTTSGIVSDRVHSEDELEIMINTPPAPIAAPSTESLALAHLLDQPSISRQTSSVGQVSLKDLEEQLAALSVRQAQKQHSSISDGESPTDLSNTSACNSSSSGSIPTTTQCTTDSVTTTDSPSSQHNVGSQCSSTCSTVVVASNAEMSTNTLTTLAVPPNGTQRRNSTSSSLELGFSHTAQNSTLSETASSCIDQSFIASTEAESVSGVYTLAHGAPPTETSGVYTMHSSEMTGQSSEIAESEKSSHYGIFQPVKSELSNAHRNRDAVDGGNYNGKRIKNEGFRLRSDSNVSTSGSFRGDGSDPTDNKHTLLSAEELTDLIVGRGTYPSRKTVSSTLDSDCDYVTLPLPIEGESYIKGHQDTAPTEDHVANLINDLLPTDPPAPPQRIDSNNLSHGNLASLSNLRMRPPPPYHASHEKTGLCGPPVHAALPAKPIPTSPSNTIAPPPPPNMPPTTSASPSKTVADPKPMRKTSVTVVRRREPPPYPAAAKPRPSSLISVASSSSSNKLTAAGGSMTSLKSEEIQARFITTRPQISILKAHTSLVNESPKPSYAAPTVTAASYVSSHQLPTHLSHNSVQNLNYAGSSQASLSLSHQHPHASVTPSPISAAAVAHAHAAAAVGAGVMPSTIGIPIVPYKSVLLPVIKPRQFLPPPPPSLPRQPPPPPPQFTGVYSSQLARKQLELYQQQLYSDVDYVIYPIQDPAVSQQEYLDAKQGSILSAMAQQPPPPHPYFAYHTATAHHPASWDTCKGHAVYRSTPYLPIAYSTHSRYASTQNLSDTYVQLPSTYSPLYSPSMASLCSSYEPPPPPPLHPAALAAAAVNTSSFFARSRSDDNILNSLDSLPKVKRTPPPPPPPSVNRRLKKPPMPAPTEKPPPIPSKPSSSLSASATNLQMMTRSQLPPRKPPTLTTNRSGHMIKTSSGAQWSGERPKPDLGLNRGSNSILAHLQASAAAAHRQQNAASQASATAAANALDIAQLREKSKHLDLPLISALCNDHSLLKQTKVLVSQKHAQNTYSLTTPSNTSTLPSYTNHMAAAQGANPDAPPTTVNSHSTSKSLAHTTTTTTTPSVNGTATAATLLAPVTVTTTTSKYPATSLTSKTRKTSISHRHPNDKLPPLPMQLAEANNYVLDPAILKHHKSYNTQS